MHIFNIIGDKFPTKMCMYNVSSLCLLGNNIDIGSIDTDR